MLSIKQRLRKWLGLWEIDNQLLAVRDKLASHERLFAGVVADFDRLKNMYDSNRMRIDNMEEKYGALTDKRVVPEGLKARLVRLEEEQAKDYKEFSAKVKELREDARDAKLLAARVDRRTAHLITKKTTTPKKGK